MTKKNESHVSEKTIGDKLKAQRKASKLSLDEVSQKLCITKTNLKRLEEESEQLPRDVYTTGFVRSYAKFLGLNASEMVEDFKRRSDETSAPKQKEDLRFPTSLPQEGIPKMKILAISACLALVVVITLNQFSDAPSDASQSVAALVSEVTIEPQNGTEKNNEEAIIPVSSGDPAGSPAPVNPNAISVKATQKSWVEIRNPYGNVIVSRIFEPGETYVLEEAENFTLHTGNAGGVQLIVGEQETPPLGRNGEVINNLLLNSEKILADLPQNR